MKPSFWTALLFLVASALSSCIREPALLGVMPVIDGWIDSEGYPVVVFTASLQPGENDQKVADKVIVWGKVTVSDGTDTVILTGGPDSDYFPPYKYYSFRMRGTPGKTYRLTAEYEDFYAEATCTMPFPTPIDSVSLRPIEGEDSLRSALLHFTSPSDVPAYYYVTMRERGKGSRAWPTLMGAVKATEPGKAMSVPVFHPKNQLDTAEYVPQLKVTEELEINLCRVTEDVYEFWDAYNNAVLFGGSTFIVKDNGDLGGNVNGGFGVWSVQGVSREYLTVE